MLRHQAMMTSRHTVASLAASEPTATTCNLGITQARTPFRSPRANAIAERWVRSARTECLDHVFIFNERHLGKLLAEYVGYFNRWRPHR